MTDALTDKTMVAITRLGDFWITPKQAELLMFHKEKESDGNFEIDGCQISCRSLDGVLTAPAYEQLQMKRRGGWQCKYGKWHERNHQCAHGMI